MTRSDRQFTLVTQNVYFGANLEPVIAAKSPLEVIEAVTAVWSQIQASNIPQRAAKIAEGIARLQPDLVGLQEVAQWFYGPLERMNLEYDFLASILDSLRARGVTYSVLAVQHDFDSPAPASADGTFLRLVDRHAVLLRTSPPSPVLPRQVHSGEFSNLFPLSGRGLPTVPRSWIAVDAEIGGAEVRVVESHIESYEAGVQFAQAKELTEGPANLDRPIVMVGDFNSNANQDPGVRDCTPTYPAVIAAGFVDSWSALNPGDPGNTGVQAADLRNRESLLDRRIDLILARGAIAPVSATLVNAAPEARTTSGLWPSDHAGIFAKFAVR